jgi:hypothetical protein
MVSAPGGATVQAPLGFSGQSHPSTSAFSGSQPQGWFDTKRPDDRDWLVAAIEEVRIQAIRKLSP